MGKNDTKAEDIHRMRDGSGLLGTGMAKNAADAIKENKKKKQAEYDKIMKDL